MQSEAEKALSQKLTEKQMALLARMWRRPVVFSGYESDEERLLMLQLYTAGLVTQITNRAKRNAMEWHSTEEGRAILRAWKAGTSPLG